MPGLNISSVLTGGRFWPVHRIRFLSEHVEFLEEFYYVIRAVIPRVRWRVKVHSASDTVDKAHRWTPEGTRETERCVSAYRLAGLSPCDCRRSALCLIGTMLCSAFAWFETI